MLEDKIKLIEAQIKFVKDKYAAFQAAHSGLKLDIDKINREMQEQFEQLKAERNKQAFNDKFKKISRYIKNRIKDLSGMDRVGGQQNNALLEEFNIYSTTILEAPAQNSFDNVPVEIIRTILFFATPKAICDFGATAKKYKLIADSDDIWVL